MEEQSLPFTAHPSTADAIVRRICRPRGLPAQPASSSDRHNGSGEPRAAFSPAVNGALHACAPSSPIVFPAANLAPVSQPRQAFSESIPYHGMDTLQGAEPGIRQSASLKTEPITFLGGRLTTGRARAYGATAWLLLMDSIHHRGQLSSYIRPMGGKQPDIYGPSGDSRPR